MVAIAIARQTVREALRRRVFWIFLIVAVFLIGLGPVLGFLTPLGCAAIISVMLVAGLLAHRKNGFFVFKDGYEYVLLIAVAVALDRIHHDEEERREHR